MPSETIQEDDRQDKTVIPRLYKNQYHREFLITTLIKHIRAGNAIDDEIRLCLEQEFDMYHIRQEDIKLFSNSISFEEDPVEAYVDPLVILYPLYEGETYILENREQLEAFQMPWKKGLDGQDLLQEKIRIRQAEVQKYQDNRAHIPPLDMALFALQTCKKIKKIIATPILNMAMSLNCCYRAYCLVKISPRLPLSGAIIHALKKQLEELQLDAWIQTEFREIINLLMFSVHLFEQKNQVGSDKKNIDEYFRKAIECDSALMYQSFWTYELRRSAFVAYTEEYLDFYKVNQSMDDLVLHMIQLARQQVSSMRSCVSMRILLSDEIDKTYSAHYYYAMVIWLKKVGLLSKESETLVALVKEEREKIRTRSVAIKKVLVPVKVPAEAVKKSKMKPTSLSEKSKLKKKSFQKPSLPHPQSSPAQVQMQEQANEQAREQIKLQQAEQKTREDARLAQEAANKREQVENERRAKEARQVLAQIRKENQELARQAEQRAIVAEKKAKREAEATAKHAGKQKKTQKNSAERDKTKTVKMAVVPAKRELSKKTFAKSIPVVDSLIPPLPVPPLLDPLHDFLLDAFEEDELSIDNRDLLKALDGIMLSWDGRLEMYGSYVVYLAMCRMKEKVKIQPNDLDLRIEIQTTPELQFTELVRQLLNLKFDLKEALLEEISLSEHLKSQMQKGYLNLYRNPQDREKHSYKIELTIMLSGVKNKNPFPLTDHSILIADNQGSFEGGDLKLQNELQLQIQQKKFTVDISCLKDPACNLSKVFPRALKNKKSWNKHYIMDPDSMVKLLTDLQLIVEIFDLRLANIYCRKACFLEMVGLITQKDFVRAEANPIIQGFLIAILKILNIESWNKRAIEIFNQERLVSVAINMRIYLQKCFLSYSTLLKDDKDSHARILPYFQNIVMIKLLGFVCMEDQAFLRAQQSGCDSILSQHLESQTVYPTSPREAPFSVKAVTLSSVTQTKLTDPFPVHTKFKVV